MRCLQIDCNIWATVFNMKEMPMYGICFRHGADKSCFSQGFLMEVNRFFSSDGHPKNLLNVCSIP